MLNIVELDEAIRDLEARPPSLATCAKLADLYTVRGHLAGEETPTVRVAPSSYSYAPPPEAQSDFLKAVVKKDPAGAWKIMDELMDTLMVVNPRVYESVMRKIDGI